MENQGGVTSVLWLGTGIMLVLAFGIIVLVLSYQNFFSKMKRREAEQLLRVSLESERNERQRIAADLHDSVSADLVAIRNYVTVIQKMPDKNSDASIFTYLRESLDNAIASARQVSHRLMPPMLDTYGLTAALSDYFERMTGKSPVVFTVTGVEQPELRAETSYELFLIVQELATNLLKYGQATKCAIAVESVGDQVAITMDDDGIPFSFASAAETTTGAGVKNIGSRLRVIGAEMSQSADAGGNHYHITLKRQIC
jgi:signal transduction histidine kinase